MDSFDNEKAFPDTSKVCARCGKVFSRPDSRRRHEKYCQTNFTGICSSCGNIFSDFYNLTRHEHACTKTERPSKKLKTEPSRSQLLATIPNTDGLIEYETAFESRLKSYFVRSNDNLDLTLFLNSVKTKLTNTIQLALTEYKAIKFNILVDCTMDNQLGEETDVTFKTKNTIVVQESDISELLDNAYKTLQNELEQTELKKSGWTLHAVDGLRLRINKYIPLRGSTYIPLPPKIFNTNSCINVKNNDKQCFRYSVLSKLVPVHPERVSKYTNLQHPYDFSDITFPTPLCDIKKFEKKNNISINVFGLDDKTNVYPLKIVDTELEDHRDLLLIDNDDGLQHYVYIKNFERLLRKQMTGHGHKILICKRCFQHYIVEYNGIEKMEEHKKLCKKNKPVSVDLPFKKPFVQFEHVERALRVPFVVYADFEAILAPIQNCQPNPELSYTLQYQKHEAMSFCTYLKCTEDVIQLDPTLPTEPYIYRGENAAAHFLQYLKNIAEKISAIYSRQLPMKQLTIDEQRRHNAANTCYMCDKTFTTNDKVRDHCHLTGRYRGAAHSTCNMRYQNPNFLPVLLHNLTGYDSHFIVRELDYDDKQIDVIPNNEEKYISFSKTITPHIKLRFIDTFRFMPSSLDKLVQTLPDIPDTSKFFTPEQLPLLTRKGVFPYEYITDWNKLKETNLPPRTAFYSHLKKCDITEEDYQHACNIWSTFKCKSLGEYSDQYLKTDVLLLADVFETFRNVTLTTHKLDPCHYFTLPGLSWDAMLRYTGIKLELLLDYDQIMMVEQSIRGGLCQVAHRYLVANNKYMKDYNPNKESTFITYQDCNNLYGYAMSQPLPYGEFQWISPEQFNIKDVTANDDYGYIVDVDVHYPPHLHKLHNDLPFLPENIIIDKQKKLVAHLNDRCRYIVHYVTLQQAIQHGLVLKKVYRVLKFRQSNWLKPYIELNTELRKNAKNNFDKDLYKLYNNSVYGKTMENIRKRKNIKLVSSGKRIEKLIAKPGFIDRTIYSENLAAVHMTQTRLTFDKALYLGASILDLSKCTLYSYFYSTMAKIYKPNMIKIGYIDTDSFIFEIKTEDLYLDMKLHLLNDMDTSDYPISHPCHSNRNKKVLGKFKDEANGKIINAFVGLRPKMYALDIEGLEILKAKGVHTPSLRQNIKFKNYIECIEKEQVFRVPTTSIRSTKHQLSSVTINKIALSPNDHKRVIQEDDKFTTKALGYRGE